MREAGGGHDSREIKTKAREVAWWCWVVLLLLLLVVGAFFFLLLRGYIA